MTGFSGNNGRKNAWQGVKFALSIVIVVLVLKYTGFLNSTSDDTGIVDKDFQYGFDLKDINGKIKHMQNLKGKVLFLNLWATWCGPCRSEMSSIQTLYNQVDTSKVAFVMLSLDKIENQPKVLKYISDKKFTFPVYLPYGELPEQLQVPSIPTTFVVGKDGKIKKKRIGTDNYDKPSFKTFLEELTAQ